MFFFDYIVLEFVLSIYSYFDFKVFMPFVKKWHFFHDTDVVK